MNRSSGIKRGLAATAISALAVTGLPSLAGTALANSMEEQAAPGAITLYAPEDGSPASIKNDGVNTTIHLVANGGDGVVQVHFEYFDGTWKNIATVSRTDGVFSTEWAPPVSVYNLPVPIRATAINNIGVEGNTDTNTSVVTANAESIDIANAPGSAVGAFQQPYAGPNDQLLGAVNGTTSDLAADPAITLSSPSGTGTVTAEDTRETVATGDTSRDWSGPVNFTGYVWDTTPADGTVNQALVLAEDESNDGEAVTLYKAQITSVSAAAAQSTVQQGGTTSVTVTVTDQNGNPIVGAEVFQDDNQDGTGDGAAKYTNSQGKAVFTGIDGTPAGKTHHFFVNTTGTATYENGTDFKRSVTVTEYVPAATSITPKSKDGAAFDDDEYAAGDVTVTVKDQNGAAMAGQIVRYAWTVTPFETTAGYPKTLPEGSATTDANGVADIPFPVGEPSGTYTLHTYINQDGTPGQGDGDLGGTDLTVKAGDSNVVWADGAVAQAPAGTTATFEASLELGDGTGLPGRNVALSWAPTGNAVMAAQASQPAGTTRTSNTSATTATGTDGSFAVALTDPPANPNVDELGGTLTATTTNTTGIGNAAETADLTVDFLRNPAPSTAADITVSSQALIDAMTTPGRPADLDITVKNSDGVALTDFPVTVQVNHGFLSPNAENAAALKADPAAAQDGLYGEWASLGDSEELTTNDSGQTGLVAAIEKDAGFNTSDTVTTTVTVTAGTVSKTITIDFTSENPLNGGDVVIERDDNQTVTVLPKAPTTEDVFYNVFVTDQFDNLVEGETVDLTDNLANADMNGADNNTSVTSQLANDGPVLTLSSDVAGDQTVDGEWTTDSNTWTDGNLVLAGFQPARDMDVNDTVIEGSSETVQWYAIDYANSVFDLSHTGDELQPVGTTVTMTYTALDQNGEPLTNHWVTFYRTGPDDLQDGDGNSGGWTNQDGEVFYVFQGAKAGTATVTAVLEDAAGNIIPQGEQTDDVSFGEPEGPIPAALTLKGGDNGAADDSLFANAIRQTEGAKVKLFRKRADGTWKRIRTGIMNAKGNFRFEDVNDKNGNGKTRYKAVVKATDATLRGVGKKTVR